MWKFCQLQLLNCTRSKSLKFYKIKHCHLSNQKLFTLNSFLAIFAFEMRCPGLVLIPDRHAKVCLVGLAHFTTCFHGILSCSCLCKFSTHIVKCICWVQTTSSCHLNQIILIKLLFNYDSLFSYSAITNWNVGLCHLCFYTCMTTIGQSENVLKSSKSFLKVLDNSGILETSGQF